MSTAGMTRTYDAAVPVTVSDATADPAGPFAGILVAVAGTVKFTDIQGNTITTGSLLAGTEIHVATSRVWSGGTSATCYGLRSPPFYGHAGKAPIT
jgi:hypothetical protein